MRRLTLALVALIGLALITLAAPEARAQPMNVIRFIHASPDAPPIDVFINGQVAVTRLRFFTTSDYLPLADGTYQVAITPAGKGTDYAVLVGDLNVKGGYAGTLVATNSQAKIEAVLYSDDLSSVAGNNARVNVMHLVPDAPALEIRLAGGSGSIFSTLTFKQRSTVAVPPGSYIFEFSPAGSANVVFTTPGLRFERGWIYTLAATGELSQGSFWVQSRVDQIPAAITAQGLSGAGFGSFTGR